MKRKTFFTYVAVALLAMVVLGYMGYQLIANFSEKIVTADAVKVTAEDKISTSGIFVREETPVYAQEGGTVEFLVEEGEKVAKDQEIAKFFGDANQLSLYRQSAALAKEIESVKYAFSHMADGSDSVKLDSLIKMNLIKMGDKLERGQVRLAEEYSAKLDAMIVQRGAAQKGSGGYEEILQELEAQKAGLDNQLAGGRAVQAQEAGYFVGTVDGREETLTKDSLAVLTAAQLKEAQNQQAPDNGAIGKIVNAYEWYFAAPVNEEQARILRNQSQAKLRFPQLMTDTINVDVYDVHQDDTGAWIAVFRSGYMHASLLSSRDQQVDIVLGTYTGVKVPKEALRQVDGEWGCYCLEGARVVFKPVEWVYQTDSYYVARESGEKGNLALYDKMVVKAKNIEKIKVVK